MDNHKIYFTNHALLRFEEAGVTPAQAKEYLRYATKEKKSKNTREWKKQKYGEDDTSFYAFGLHLFTVKKTLNKYGEKIALVITYTYKPNNNWFYKK